MNSFFRVFLFIFGSFFLFSSCSKNPNIIDISNVNLQLKIVRFEKELMQSNSDSIEDKILNFEQNHSDFFAIFNQKIINIGGTNQKDYPIYLQKFVSDAMIVEINKSCETEFSDFEPIENELNDAFKHYKYYFPSKTIPTIYTYISGFNQSIVTSENIIGIGLDKYLGVNSDYYTKLNIPNFSKKNMHKQKITSDVMYAWATSEFPFNDSIDNLLNEMIYQGKIMYFLDRMLPEMHDTLKIGYTEKQLDWNDANEKKMWTFLVEQKLLFNSDYMEIKSFVSDGPFTKAFSQNSPPKAGIWLGWQIVRSYMENNKVQLADLMKNNDYQKILNQSKYKP